MVALEAMYKDVVSMYVLKDKSRLIAFAANKDSLMLVGFVAIQEPLLMGFLVALKAKQV